MRYRYKYLNYVPRPINLESNTYKLVNDEEFCSPDGRIPLLMVTQYGIFPSKDIYRGRKVYSKLEGLENQTVGFVRRGYLSNREYDGIIELFIDTITLEKVRKNVLKIDFELLNEI